MANYCGLTTKEAKARISIGGFSVEEPYIINITVSRTRGQLVGTAQGSFHVPSGSFSEGGGSLVVIKILNSVVFTGTAKRIDVSPSYRCAGELIVKFAAEDFLHKIQGKTITRRQKHPGLGQLAFIVGHYKRVNMGFDSPAMMHDIERGSSPVDFLSTTTNIADWSQFSRNGETSTIGDLHPVTRISDPLVTTGGAAGGGAIDLHDHSSLDTSGPHAGGPAVAVFGVK